MLLVLAGAVCTVVLSGLAGDLALGVMGLGVVLAASLVFLEVGFSEDRERAREQAVREQERGQAAHRHEPTQRPLRPARPRLERVRGRPRRPH
ncbi:MAG: hypothetical protein JO262_14880 [Solirubrobacterales bacterium]|nr:hypothetical protein [Solirubrobacterales bacterium]